MKREGAVEASIASNESIISEYEAKVAFRVISFLNDMRRKAGPGVLLHIPAYASLPKANDSNAISLLGYGLGLESLQSDTSIALAATVDWIGESAIAEVRRLMSIGDERILLNSLCVLQHVKCWLAVHAIDVIASATCHPLEGIRVSAEIAFNRLMSWKDLKNRERQIASGKERNQPNEKCSLQSTKRTSSMLIGTWIRPTSNETLQFLIDGRFVRTSICIGLFRFWNNREIEVRNFDGNIVERWCVSSLDRRMLVLKRHGKGSTYYRNSPLLPECNRSSSKKKK